MMADPADRVSVIIAVKNGEATIRRCLLSVLAMDDPDFEVIVIDDGSNDGTASILESEPLRGRITLMRNQSSLGPSAARNAAVACAKGAWVAFTDGDCIVPVDWLRCLRDGLRRCPGAVSCGGGQRLPADSTLFESRVFSFMQNMGFLTEYIKQSRSDGIMCVNHNPSCNVIYARDVFLREGGFWEGFWPGEDVEFDYRLRRKGLKLVFNPRAAVYHYRARTLRGFARMMLRYGWAQGVLVRKYGFFRMVQIVPLLSCAAAAAFFAGCIVSPAVCALVAGACVLLVFIKAGSPRLAAVAFVQWNLGFVRGALGMRS